MRKFGIQKPGLGTLSLTRQNLKAFIAAEQKKSAAVQYLQSSFLLMSAALVFTISAFILVLDFYAVPISFSKRGWAHIRNLTPVVSVETHVNGALEQVFVSPGQLVQKGELLGAVQTAPIKLDYEDAQREFAFKVIELHCLVSLQSNKSVFKLPYDAQKLVDQAIDQSDIYYRVTQCERELLRNAIADQSLEEAIAALEDHSILLENIAKQRDLAKQPQEQNPGIVYDRKDGSNYPADKSHTDMDTAVGDRLQSAVQLAETRQKLQTARKDYFLRKLQKEEELGAAIEQATRDMRYLDDKLRELNEQLDNNFIYAIITGTVVGTKIAKIGNYYKKFDPVFTLQPIDNEFQVSFALKEEDADKFIVGTPTIVSLAKNRIASGHLIATTAAVLRKPNGKLEAVLDLEGNAKKNAEIILASGYSGAGVQRFPASITTGQVEIWKSIRGVFLKEPVPNL